MVQQQHPGLGAWLWSGWGGVLRDTSVWSGAERAQSSVGDLAPQYLWLPLFLPHFTHPMQTVSWVSGGPSTDVYTPFHWPGTL